MNGCVEYEINNKTLIQKKKFWADISFFFYFYNGCYTHVFILLFLVYLTIFNLVDDSICGLHVLKPVKIF